MLRDTQKHPENYRDLVVRVAGFSAFFTELARVCRMKSLLAPCRVSNSSEIQRNRPGVTLRRANQEVD